jgi:hypothetical protein
MEQRPITDPEKVVNEEIRRCAKDGSKADSARARSDGRLERPPKTRSKRSSRLPSNQQRIDMTARPPETTDFGA